MVDNAWVELRGKDLLLKVVKDMKTGDDTRPIKSGEAVFLDVTGYYCEEPPSSTAEYDNDDDNTPGVFKKAQGWLVIVGQKDIVEAVDTALANMNEGQTAYVWSHSKFALGKGTRKWKNFELPSEAGVLYKVVATKVVMDTSRLNPYFTIQKTLTRKKIANDIYQHELLILKPSEAAANVNHAAQLQALKLYRQAARDMSDLLTETYFNSVEPDHPQRKECTQLMIDSYNNVVAVYMQTRQYEKAKDAAEIVLKKDYKNLKALLRNAKAHVYTATNKRKLSEAEEAIKAAEDAIGYNDKAEEAELKKLRSQWKQRQKQLQEQSATTE